MSSQTWTRELESCTHETISLRHATEAVTILGCLLSSPLITSAYEHSRCQSSARFLSQQRVWADSRRFPLRFPRPQPRA